MFANPAVLTITNHLKPCRFTCDFSAILAIHAIFRLKVNHFPLSKLV